MTAGAWLKVKLHRPEVRYGLQTFLGLFCFLAILSPPAVWNTLSLKNATITPVYAVASFMVCLQANVGTALLFVAQRIAGAVLGGALGVAATYITYGANGSTFTASTTKGAVMVTVICIMVFVLSLYRYRYPRFSFFFAVASFSVPMVALSGYHLDYVENKVVAYWILEIAMSVVAAGLAAMLIIPNTAGAAVVASTRNSITLLGSSAVELMDILFNEKKEGIKRKQGRGSYVQDGSAQQKCGTIQLNSRLDDGGLDQKQGLKNDGGVAAAQKLTLLSVSEPPSIETFMELYIQPVSAALIKSKANLEATGTEINIYHIPHIFPKAAYKVLLTVLRHFLSTLMTVRYLLEGEAPLGATRPLQRHINPVVVGIKATFDALAQCLTSDAGDEAYLKALSELKELETALHALGSVRIESTESTEYLDSEVLMADTVLASVFSLGSFVRRACFIMPDALPHHGKGVRSPWRKHFKGSVWDFEATPGHPRMQELAVEAKSPLAHRLSSLTESLPSFANLQAVVAAERRDGDVSVRSTASTSPRPSKAGLPPPSPPYTRTPSRSSPNFLPSQSSCQPPFPSVVEALDQEVDGRSTQWSNNWKDALRRHTGFSWEEVSLATQMAVSLAIACTLHVCTATYNALDKRTIWIIVTVVVLLQHSMGGLLLRSANRMVATLATGLLGMGVLYGVYLINGLSYTNKFVKFGAMCVLLPGVEGIAAWAGVISPHLWGYGYMVLKLSLPIVVLPGYSSDTLTPTTALWRLCNVAIGLFIELIVGAIVMPVSTRAIVKRRVRDTLDALAQVTSATSLHTLGADNKVKSPKKSLINLVSPRQVNSSRVSNDSSVRPSSPRDLETGAVVAPSSPSSQRAPGGSIELRMPAQHVLPPTLSPFIQNLPPIRTSMPHSPPENSPNTLSPRSPASTEAYFSDTPRAGPMRRRRIQWLKRAVYGAPVLQLRPLGVEVASRLHMLHELTDVVLFEEKVLPAWGRSLTTENMVAARRAMRRYLNALLSFSYVLCGPEVPHLRLLLPFRPHIETVAVQLAECLRAAGAVAAGRLAPGGGAPTQRALQAQVQALLAEVESVPPPEECTEADAILGFASLGVLVAVVQTMDEVRGAVDRLFSIEDNERPSKHVTATPLLPQDQPSGAQLSSRENPPLQLHSLASSAHIIFSGADEQHKQMFFARSASSMQRQGLSAPQGSRAGVTMAAASAAAANLAGTGEDEEDLVPRTNYD